MKSALRRLLVISAAAIAASTLAPRAGAAQEPGARRGDPPLVSPDVAADRRVTFRLRAPAAKVVTVRRLRQRCRIAKERRGHLERDGRSARPRDVRLFLHRRRCTPDGPEQPAGEDRLRDQHDHQPADRPRRRARLLRRSGCASRRDPDAALQVAVEWRDARTDGLRAAGIRRGS